MMNGVDAVVPENGAAAPSEGVPQDQLSHNSSTHRAEQRVELSKLSLESLKERARKMRHINEDTLAHVDEMVGLGLDGKEYLVDLLAAEITTVGGGMTGGGGGGGAPGEEELGPTAKVEKVRRETARLMHAKEEQRAVDKFKALDKADGDVHRGNLSKEQLEELLVKGGKVIDKKEVLCKEMTPEELAYAYQQMVDLELMHRRQVEDDSGASPLRASEANFNATTHASKLKEKTQRMKSGAVTRAALRQDAEAEGEEADAETLVVKGMAALMSQHRKNRPEQQS